MTIPQDTYTPRYDVLAILLILTSFAVRYWFTATGQLNLVQDEAQYWDWIRRPQLSYYSKGPLIAWLISAWTYVFGNTELGVRFGSVIGMTGIQAALYLGVSRVWKRHSLALYVLFVAATMPLLNGLGVLATTDNPLILCWTTAFFALSAAVRNKPDHTPSNWPFIILAASLAVGILAKYMMLAFLGLAVIHAVILQLRGQMPPRFWSRFILASLVGGTIGLAPIILWNMDNNWVAYKHVATLSAAGPSRYAPVRFMPFLEMLGAQIGLFAPWWFLFAMTGSWSAMRTSWTGPIGRFDAGYRHGLQALLFFWPLWGIITFKALFSKVEANWTAVAFMGGALLGGMALKLWWEAPGRKPRTQALLAGAAVLVTAAIYFSPMVPVPDNLNPTHRLKGWEDLGLQVDRLKQTAFTDADKVFIFSDNYGITSELAFYTPGQPVAYCSWTENRRMNQYDLWPAPGQERIGWDAVMVRARDEDGIPTALETMFTSVSKPMNLQTAFNEKPGRRFTIILCKGFTGIWPKQGFGKY